MGFCLLIAGGVIVFADALLTSVNSGRKGGSMSEPGVVYSKPKIHSRYDEVETWEIPAVVPLTDEERIYIIEILSAFIRIIEGTSSLEQEEEQVLGRGQFYWPKNPEEPVKLSKSYFGNNFRMFGIAARISRENVGAPWKKAGVTVHPQNFPKGVYSMQLPASFFSNFELLAVTQEERDGQVISSPIVFRFKHKKIQDIELRVEGRVDVINARDPFPTSFHFLEISRKP